jgi:hypothetical protein
MPTKKGPYSSDDLGKDATGPLKVTEMKMPDMRPKSFADVVDSNSNEESNLGLSASIKVPRKKR